MVLLSRTDDEHVKNAVVTSTWGRDFLQRTGFRSRAVTTSKVEKPESAKEGAGLQHHYLIQV